MVTENPSDGPRQPSDKPDQQGGDHDLRSRAFSGALWTVLVRWGTLLISWPATIILARILAPEDFGYLALVSVFTRFAVLIAEGGVSNAIVLGEDLSDVLYRRLHGWSLSFFTATCAIVIAFAIPIENLYSSPGARWLVVVFACGGMLEGVSLVPVARMRRNLQFRELAKVHATMIVIEAFVSVGFAFLGFGYWAIAIGYIVGRITYAIQVSRYGVMRPLPPRLSGLKSTLMDAKRLLVAQISTFIAESSDAWVGGYVAGTRALGGYSFMSGLAKAPVEKISGIIMYVSAAAMGNIRKDPERLASATVRMVSITAMIMFPVFAGIALIADDLVNAVLGAKWAPFVPALQIYCIYAATTPLKSIMVQSATAAGAASDVARAGIILLLILPPSFYILGSEFGATGLALAWLLPIPFVFLKLYLALSRHLDITLSSLLLAVQRPFICVIAMIAGLLAISEMSIVQSWGEWHRLGIKTLIGISLYLAAVLIFQRHNLRWSLSLVETRFPQQAQTTRRLLHL